MWTRSNLRFLTQIFGACKLQFVLTSTRVGPGKRNPGPVVLTSRTRRSTGGQRSSDISVLALAPELCLSERSEKYLVEIYLRGVAVGFRLMSATLNCSRRNSLPSICFRLRSQACLKRILRTAESLQHEIFQQPEWHFAFPVDASAGDMERLSLDVPSPTHLVLITIISAVDQPGREEHSRAPPQIAAAITTTRTSLTILPFTGDRLLVLNVVN